METRKKLVVLGAGFAGLTLYNKLVKKFDIIVVDRKDFFEYSPNFLQNIGRTTSGFKGIVFKLDSVVSGGRFIQAGLKLLKRHTVELEPENVEETKGRLLKLNWEVKQESRNTLEVSFDFCVVCIGSQYSAPIRSALTHLSDRVAEVQKTYNSIFSEKIKHVVVCGGGFVGVEAACGIAKSRKVKVTLIHRGSEICKGLSAKAREAINLKIREHNVIVRLNEAAVHEQLEEEDTLVLDCTGAKNAANKSLFDQSFKLDQDGSIIVGDQLQFAMADSPEEPGISRYAWNIYGAGDCVRTLRNSARLGYIAILHADFIAANLVQLLEIEKHKPSKNYLEFERLVESCLIDDRDYSQILPKYSKLKEPNVLLLYVGSSVLRCSKDGVSTCTTVNCLMKWYIQKSTAGALKGNCVGNCFSSLNKFFNRMLYT